MQSGSPTAERYRWPVDRLAIARAERRRQAAEELEFERDRATALQTELERIVAELDGAELDAEVFAKMDPADVELVRTAIQVDAEFGGDEVGAEFLEGGDGTATWGFDQREEQEAELVRLQGEIASSERRQQALERYLEALGT